ncbi:ParB/RepB/Spo0J family partition protein [Lelliottia wanjuensis]|uniref:Plasmid partitioning protein RepB C-terminal domain-containing protein n=1 Tax=Lelliottia wanjuensis TaxID=3050585 RepID=A0AAP4LCP4_9ENTR|nr:MULTISPECIES: plasmid partitioning protein RepB C-terminal domain-containing protein [unclassified Lelliottia]MDK9365758.1 plasmid partitioning protein RepB C-terminal domain-containing protein [Lelliottia sp. V106_12]MDK9618313.1 plasmid partitioning protein RepB C-terminal domain-containing protein [Lelliottia sp. V106_9]
MNSDEKIKLIQISRIYISNPRKRDKFTHDEIKKNIHQIGLKRPISVRKIIDDTYDYALICGQGRLEAYLQYGETHIPAIIKVVDEETGHLMSLTENIARRKPRATELLESVSQLKKQGLTDKEIGDCLGYTTSWVNGVISLLEKGEKKLLTAFEAGHIPLYLAVEISRANDDEIQDSLTEALMNGKIKGNQINIIKRIIERRKVGDKGATNKAYVHKRPARKYTPEELSDIYQKNADEHIRIQAKAKYARETFLAVKEIFRKLTRDEQYCLLLRKNNITDMPACLSYSDKELIQK